MRVLINGKEVEVDDGISLNSLLQKMQIQIRPIGLAVAVNEEVVPKSKYEEFILKEGDRIEIVNIVGGG